MKKFLFLFLFLSAAISLSVKAQTPAQIVIEQPYGKVDQADLEMTSCDFEKDANAEVLFNFGKLYYGDDLKTISIDVHKRIKFFNSNGNDQANIHISYLAENRLENITGIEAQTINLVDGKPVITKLDKKLIYTNIIDKEYSEITFTLPNVQPGCIIEYKYKWNARYNASIDPWVFQDVIPVKYSEYDTSIPDVFYFRVQPHFGQPLVKHTVTLKPQVLTTVTHTLVVGTTTQSNNESDSYNYNNNNEVWGMANIPALRADAYMSSFDDNVQRLSLDLISIKPIGGFNTTYADTWSKVGYELSRDDDFGDQLNRTLANEDDIISKATLLKTNDEKIAYIFNEVKNAMKWNGLDRWYTNDGTSKAWQNKTGNATEINLILYHLLKKSGVSVYPMVVSTRKNGRIDPYYTSLIQFNRSVVYIPVDSTKNYVLDASGKYNLYNETPAELLNSMGLWIDKSKKTYDTVFLKKDQPVRQVILVNAEIKPGGKVEGTVQVNSTSYDKIATITRYKKDGEDKYIEFLKDGDNSLKITSLKFENMDVDSLPLTQNLSFNLDLPGADENYIYLKPNLFTSLNSNPFLSDTRLADIYFGYLRNYSINGVYKLPAGYKTDALPKSVSMTMPDKSIIFKRIVAEQDGSILVHYIIDYRKVAFNANEYPGIHDFYKKMFELLNEQVVLKKG